MSCRKYYDLCNDNIGEEVEIRDHHGKMYVGSIERVDRDRVYLRPIGSAPDSGNGLFFFAAAALTAIALVSIVSLRFRRRPFF